MSSLAKPRYTPKQYLKMERKAEQKHEYVSGEIFLLGEPRPIKISPEEAQARHGQLFDSVAVGLSEQFISPRFYVVANATVGGVDVDFAVIDEGEAGQKKKAPAPVVVVEVLSPYTEGYDRGEKARRIRAMPSISHLVLVAQDDCRVEHYERQDQDLWGIRELSGLAAILRLPSIGCELLLSQIYARVTFEPDPRMPGNTETTEN